MLAVIGTLEMLIILALLVGFGLLLRRMGRWALVFLVGLFAVCSLTNPSEAEHRDAVFSRVQAELDPIERVAASALLNKDMLPLRYQNFVVGSMCTLDNRPVSWGVLKNVIVADSPPQSNRR